MALLTAGWWQPQWWPSQWWHDQWWLEYGAYVPPPPPAAAPSFGQAPTPRFPIYLVQLIRDYLESEVS